MGAPNLLDYPMFAARLSYAFWDPEPGYYAAGTYLGARKALTLAVHGRYRKPCPVCAAPVQRVVYAENEMNYCARCQTGGRLLADRALSRLLRDDWPRTLEELEERRRGA